jgi:hypothetical protein
MKIKVVQVANCNDCQFAHWHESAFYPGCDLVPEPSVKFLEQVRACVGGGPIPDKCPLRKEVRIYILKKEE